MELSEHIFSKSCWRRSNKSAITLPLCPFSAVKSRKCGAGGGELAPQPDEVISDVFDSADGVDENDSAEFYCQRGEMLNCLTFYLDGGMYTFLYPLDARHPDLPQSPVGSGILMG
jgi:hypothetical protein